MILNDEQQMVRDTARAFAQDKLAPFAAEWDREHKFPTDALTEMASLGFLGMTIPEEWDGAGLDYVSYAAAVIEIAAGCGAVSTIMSVHNGVGCMPILTYGDDAQREKFLKPMARGEKIGCFCLTEPDAGSDAASIRTRARRDGDHYIINGVKQFITSGRMARSRSYSRSLIPKPARTACPRSSFRRTRPAFGSFAWRKSSVSMPPTPASSPLRTCACRRRRDSARKEWA